MKKHKYVDTSESVDRPSPMWLELIIYSSISLFMVVSGLIYLLG